MQLFQAIILALFFVHCSVAQIPAAIFSQRSVEEIPMQSSAGNYEPTAVDIGSVDMPVALNFLSRSSTLRTTQRHMSAPGSLQQSSVTDEPQRLMMDVMRPVMQNVREVIVPSRNIIQEIRPVRENVQIMVARGQARGNGGQRMGEGYGGFGGQYGAYGGGLGGGYGQSSRYSGHQW